jgi:Sulfotransferase domain
MPLPDFFVIGAPKAGTTALYEALCQHPSIYMPRLKEPQFFTTDQRRWRIKSPVRYLALFSSAAPGQTIGEASTSYLSSPAAATRIQKNAPGAKLIAVLRQPVERFRSSYWYYVVRGWEPAHSLEEAIDNAHRGGDFPSRRHLLFGLYHAQLSYWYPLFAPEQFRIYLYEELRSDPQAVLRDLFAFLGVDPHFAAVIPEANVTQAPRSRRLDELMRDLPRAFDGVRRLNMVSPPPMRPETWDLLLDYYRPDIEQLQGLIGRDLSHWLHPATDRSVAPA